MKPMLCHDYNKRGKSIVYPAYVQPKLDGIRVIAHRTANGVRYFSRNEKEFHTLGHLSAQIMAISPPESWLDGEIYVMGVPFEDICSAVKRDRPNTASKRMQYWVFDIIVDLPFSLRNNLLRQMSEKNRFVVNAQIFLPAIEVASEEQMKRAHKTFTENGFEGTIIRNADAKYVHGRTAHIQKYKDFQDDEFEIVGSKQATGKDANMIIFTCITKGGVEFDVEPAGDDDTRREMWNRRNEFNGKKLTVKFQNYTNSGAPRFPTAGIVRDYE